MSGLKRKGQSNPSPVVLCSFPEHKQLLKNAQVELKKSKRKDYYKILGVNKNASEDEIKKAYRKRALMHHPGTHSSPLCPVQPPLRQKRVWKREFLGNSNSDPTDLEHVLGRELGNA